MTKAQWKTVGILLLVILLLAAVLMIQTKTTEEEPKAVPLVDLGNSQIVQMNFANTSDYVYLGLKNGAWVMTDDPDFPVNQDAVATLTQALTASNVETTIAVESQASLDRYNLLAPQCIIEYVLSDGSAHGIRIGTMSSITDKIYVCLDEDTTLVYVVSPELLQAFSCKELDLIAYPVIPTPKEVSSVTVTNRSGTIKLNCLDGKWMLETEDGMEEISEETAYNFYMLPWDMHWRGVVGYKEENLSSYDLSAPRISYSITYPDGKEEKTWTVSFGSSLPDGTCYASVPDNPAIYLLDSLMADWLDGQKAEDLLNDSSAQDK